MPGRNKSPERLAERAANHNVLITKKGNVRCLDCEDKWPLDPTDKLWWLCPRSCNMSQRSAVAILSDPTSPETTRREAEDRLLLSRRVNESSIPAYLDAHDRREREEEIRAILNWPPDDEPIDWETEFGLR